MLLRDGAPRGGQRRSRSSGCPSRRAHRLLGGRSRSRSHDRTGARRTTRRGTVGARRGRRRRARRRQHGGPRVACTRSRGRAGGGSACRGCADSGSGTGGADRDRALVRVGYQAGGEAQRRSAHTGWGGRNGGRAGRGGRARGGMCGGWDRCARGYDWTGPARGDGRTRPARGDRRARRARGGGRARRALGGARTGRLGRHRGGAGRACRSRPCRPVYARRRGGHGRSRGRSAARQLGHPKLELANMFLGLGRPLAQRRCLARLGEEQQHQDGQADDRGKAGIGAHRGHEVVNREGERNGSHGVLRQSMERNGHRRPRYA